MKLIAMLLTSAITVCSLSSQAMAGEIWQGKGEIVRGTGEGGILELKIEVEGNTVKFLSGPSQNQQITFKSRFPFPNGTIQLAQNSWSFERKKQELVVTLYQQQPYRVILYRLYPQ
jgi:hypothetical protein